MKERNHYKEYTHWLAWWYFTYAVRTHGKISNELVTEWLKTTKAYSRIEEAARKKWLAGRSIAIRKMLGEWGVGR